jgi:hypothetical protein
LVFIPKKSSEKTAQNAIQSIIVLKYTLELIPGLVQSMLGCEHELFGTILKNLQHEDIKELYDKISEIIDDTATHEKGAQKQAMQVRNNY